MLKHAHDRGYTDALASFGLEKYAKGFIANTKAHASNLKSGIKEWRGTTVRSRAGKNPGIRAQAGQAAGKAKTLASAKGLLPAAGIGLAGLWGAKKLFGKSDEEKRRAAAGLG